MDICLKTAGSRSEDIEIKSIPELQNLLHDPAAQGKTFKIEGVLFYLVHGDSYTGTMTITTKNGSIVYCVKVGLQDENQVEEIEKHQIQGRMWNKFENVVNTSAEDFQRLSCDDQTSLLQNINGVYSCNVHIANKDGYNLEISKVVKRA